MLGGSRTSVDWARAALLGVPAILLGAWGASLAGEATDYPELPRDDLQYARNYGEVLLYRSDPSVQVTSLLRVNWDGLSSADYEVCSTGPTDVVVALIDDARLESVTAPEAGELRDVEFTYPSRSFVTEDGEQAETLEQTGNAQVIRMHVRGGNTRCEHVSGWLNESMYDVGDFAARVRLPVLTQDIRFDDVLSELDITSDSSWADATAAMMASSPPTPYAELVLPPPQQLVWSTSPPATLDRVSAGWSPGFASVELEIELNSRSGADRKLIAVGAILGLAGALAIETLLLLMPSRERGFSTVSSRSVRIGKRRPRDDVDAAMEPSAARQAPGAHTSEAEHESGTDSPGVATQAMDALPLPTRPDVSRDLAVEEVPERNGEAPDMRSDPAADS